MKSFRRLEYARALAEGAAEGREEGESIVALTAVSNAAPSALPLSAAAPSPAMKRYRSGAWLVTSYPDVDANGSDAGGKVPLG
jgi:hypothetical protein